MKRRSGRKTGNSFDSEEGSCVRVVETVILESSLQENFFEKD